MAALLAAVLFVLQSVVGSYAQAAQYAGPTHDAFGNPLCLTSHDGSAPSPDHQNMPKCCVLGCAGLSNGLISAPDAGALPILAEYPAFFTPERAYPAIDLQPDYNPGSPRAPPRLI